MVIVKTTEGINDIIDGTMVSNRLPV